MVWDSFKWYKFFWKNNSKFQLTNLKNNFGDVICYAQFPLLLPLPKVNTMYLE